MENLDDEKNGENCQIFALDCEMVRTTKKHELARISLVNAAEEILIDMFVKVEFLP